MAKINFTAARVDGFKCEPGKSQCFLWDAKAPGLGLRATASGARAYIFQAKLRGATIRVTIGDPRSWNVDQAQDEARRLQRLIDEGIDPREHRTAQVAEHEARKAERRRGDVTFGETWDQYVELRKSVWGERHYQDHLKHAAVGGLQAKIGNKRTKPGPLAALRPLKLGELSADLIAAWLEKQNSERPTMTALSYRLLRAFIRWADDVEAYRGLIADNVHGARRVKEKVSRPKTKEGDCLQREQLPAWFAAVRNLENPVASAYLQSLLLTGARREELAALRWEDVDFKWRSLAIKDKVETDTGRTIPLTPYVAELLLELKRRNELPPTKKVLAKFEKQGQGWAPSPWVFESSRSEDGKLVDPRTPHIKALKTADLPHISLHGLRRSFGTLAEWVECPTGVVAQIQGHKPSAIAEKHYRRRPLDLLRMWHDKIEAWMLNEAGIQEIETNVSITVL